MSIRIYTYSDPYRLNETSFWDDIKDFPHLCVSQVMVNAFRQIFKMGEDFTSLVCPIDSVIEQLFKEWQSVEARIGQYVALSKQFEKRYRQKDISQEFYVALKHNQGSFLNALRLFIELGIHTDDLNPSNPNVEQQMFLELLGEMESPLSPLADIFSLRLDPTLPGLLNAFRATIHKLFKDQKLTQSIRDTLYSRFTESSLSCVVIHGVHQFSPLQLRFILLLESLGVDVVFLYNYQEEFKEIYGTWERLYQLFDVPVYRDTKITRYVSHSQGYEIAKAFASLFDSGQNRSIDTRKRWREIASNVSMIAFDNLTEYAGFIAQYFDQAIQQYQQYKGKVSSEAKNGGRQPNSALAFMSEHVYTAGREIHDLLQMYYPEYAGERRFLNYPIGQFFMALYKLWDPDLRQIRVDWSLLHDCLEVGVIPVKDDITELLGYIEMYVADVETYDELCVRMKEYQERYSQVQGLQNEIGKELRRISFYHRNFVTKDKLDALISMFDKLNAVAKQLFDQGENTHGQISFREHFKRLEDFIKNEMPSEVRQAENDLIEDLLARLQRVGQTSLSGSFGDLIEGLNYYLRQSSLTNPSWIVRNFEQIEGDVLLSKNQYEQNKHDLDAVPVYHFGYLSDRAMSPNLDQLLPWPLTDDFINRAYVPLSLAFQVYYTGLSEYANFLRYSLFYGLYYNHCNVRLSYVRHVDDFEEQPYFPTQMLGMIFNPSDLKGDTGEPFSFDNVAYSNPRKTRIDEYHRMDFFLCPEKYFFDYICQDGIVVDNMFQLRHYYANMLIRQVRSQKPYHPNEDNKVVQERISSLLDKAERQLKPYFPFWRPHHFVDLKNEALNYLRYVNEPASSYNSVNQATDKHMDRRLLFWRAKWVVDQDTAQHPVPEFEKMVARGDKVEYSLPGVAYSNESLNEAINKFMHDEEFLPNPGPWCIYCSHQKICMKPYLKEQSEPGREV